MSNHTNNAKKTAQDDVDQIKEDLSKVRDDLRTAGEHVVERGREAGERVYEQGKEKYEHARDKAYDGYEQARDKAYEGMDYAVEYTRERPLVVVAAAFGVGVLAGILLRRR